MRRCVVRVRGAVQRALCRSVPLLVLRGVLLVLRGAVQRTLYHSVPLCTTLYHSVPLCTTACTHTISKAIRPSVGHSRHQRGDQTIRGGGRVGGGGGRGVTTYLFLWSDGCREDTSLGVLRPSSRGGRLPLGAATNAPTGPALGERGLSPPESVNTSSSRSNPSNASSMSP